MDSEELNEEARKEQERLEKRKQGDLKKILSMPEGRRFIWEELSDCGIFRGSFNPNNSVMSFQEGQRDIGIKLLERVNAADRGAFSRMQSEFLSEAMKNKKDESAQTSSGYRPF